MEIGISGYHWIDLSKTNPAPDFLVKKYGEIFAQVLYNRRDLFDKDFSQDYIFPELKNLVNPSYFHSLEENISKEKPQSLYMEIMMQTVLQAHLYL
jgi:single-stranded-DNA-specific exonuclease